MRTLRSTVASVALLAVIGGACSSTPDQPEASVVPTTPAAPTTTRIERASTSDPLDCENWRYGPDDEPALGTLPAEFDRSDYRRTVQRDLRFATSPTDQCGQMGAAIDLAWGVTQGRDDVVIAVLDSGIEWRDPEAMTDLAIQAYINLGEAGPECSADVADTDASAGDCNADGRFDISDFVSSTGGLPDLNNNGVADPEDLILSDVWSDGVDDDDNGYIDDISGWDFLYGDNNPLDTVAYGHGTGEAKDSVAAANGQGDVGTCPRCRFLPVRVSDSFIADGLRFAAGVHFAADSGADVVQEALGAISNPSAAQAAIDEAVVERDIPVVASMADEASAHANLPAALEHTLAVNSITEKLPLLGGEVEGYLALNGCTNYGGITAVSVPSNACSSEATGIMSGIVGLTISAARDGGYDYTARELMQLVRTTADDVDFSGDLGESQGGLVDTVRYPTTPGWDAVHGAGRVNAYELVKAARAGRSVGFVDLTTPKWFDIYGPDDVIEVRGLAQAAAGAESFGVRTEWAVGLQPPQPPAVDEWHVVAETVGYPETEYFARIDASTMAPSSEPPYDADARRPDEHRHAYRVRTVIVTEGGANDGALAIDQRQVFVHDDPTRLRFERIAGVGTSSPVFAQLDSDAGDELLVATDDGTLHAYDVNFDELPGFPIVTQPPTWWRHRSTGGAQIDVGSAFMVGAPQVADLDGDGRVEIIVSNFDGALLAFHADGTPVAGFPVAIDPRWSRDDPATQDRFNRTKPHIYAQPVIGDLDGDDSPEVVAAAGDRHVYAWHANGTPVAGFPVQIVDPAKVAAIDLATGKVTFALDSGVRDGGEIIAAPALGDVDGDGDMDIVVGAQEQYEEPVNIGVPEGGSGTDVLGLLAAASTLGNTRLYAIDGSGELLDGWPVKLGMVALEVLPTIGGGVATSAIVADVHPKPGNEVIAASAAGPAYVFGGDGVSVFGRVDGPSGPASVDVPLAWSGGLDGAGLDRFGSARTTTDTLATFVSFGGPTVGDLDGDGALDIAAPGGGLTRLLDVQAADLQLPNDDHLLAWDPRTGDFLPGFPHTTSDIAFFVVPLIADVDGDDRNEVVAGNGVNVLSAVSSDGSIPAGWPKATGGWLVGSVALGDLEGDGRPEVAAVRRDGALIVWSTDG